MHSAIMLLPGGSLARMASASFPKARLMARVMVLEQIYRGFQILEGGKYHK